MTASSELNGSFGGQGGKMDKATTALRGQHIRCPDWDGGRVYRKAGKVRGMLVKEVKVVKQQPGRARQNS